MDLYRVDKKLGCHIKSRFLSKTRPNLGKTCVGFSQEGLHHTFPDLYVEIFEPMMAESEVRDLAWQRADFHKPRPGYTLHDFLPTIKGHNLIEFPVYHHDLRIPRQLRMETSEIEPVELLFFLRNQCEERGVDSLLLVLALLGIVLHINSRRLWEKRLTDHACWPGAMEHECK